MVTNPYVISASYYDRLTHVAVDRLYANLVRLMEMHGFAPTSVLDLGCGTGALLKRFLKHGIRVFGCDLSPRMVETAKADGQLDSCVVCASMLDELYTDKYDLVLCTNDALNYLVPDAWPELIERVASVLTQGGWFYLDFDTPFDMSEIWPGYVDVIHDEDFTLIREYSCDPKLAHGRETQTWFVRDGDRFMKHVEFHETFSLPLETVLQIAEEGGLTLMSCYDPESFDESNGIDATRIGILWKLKAGEHG